ncbi:multicopper oxidase-domain-containing protein [Biscogniauxia marginata]|nr:multicopper oxidase-domain-containing protein [Biscogniauxia marginata]
MRLLRPARDTTVSDEIRTDTVLPGTGDDDDRRHLLFTEADAEKTTTPSKASSHPRWFFYGIAVVFFIAIVRLCWLLLSLNPQAGKSGSTEESSPTEQPTTTWRRPGNDYILDPGWDFGVPNQVRSYDWTIVDTEGNPDGVFKPMMLINGQFPGPLIEINQGDIIAVNVHNQASNATAIHWHGIFQNGTNWMDGAAGVTQCPIAPGRSYQYKFNVTGQAGTYFYHGHQGVQALDGLVGPLVVHSRSEADHQPIPYSSDRVILLQDWYYDSASGLMRQVLSPGVEDAPIPNTALINGANQAECDYHPGRKCHSPERASLPTLNLALGASHRLRFLNVGGYSWFQVAIDEHSSLPVIEVDGTPVEPAPAGALTIAPGQRYSAVLTANQTDKQAFWLRARMVTSCFAKQTLPENGTEEARAIVRYRSDNMQTRHEGHDEEDEEDTDDDGSDLPLPVTTSQLEYISTCQDMSSTTRLSPSPPQPAPASADHSWYLRVNLAIGDWRLQRGVMNASSFRPHLTSPTLHRVLDGLAQNNASFSSSTATSGVNAAAFDPRSELVISHPGIETVDLVLQNMDENSHPFHLHGYAPWVLAAGHGYFPGYAALGLPVPGPGDKGGAEEPPPGGRRGDDKPSATGNPLRRDTVTAEGFGWVLLRFVADNPGVWLFHCHVAWHSEAGMGMLFLTRLSSRDDNDYDNNDDDDDGGGGGGASMRGWRVPEDARTLCDDVPAAELMKGASPGDEEFAGFGGSDSDSGSGSGNEG